MAASLALASRVSYHPASLCAIHLVVAPSVLGARPARLPPMRPMRRPWALRMRTPLFFRGEWIPAGICRAHRARLAWGHPPLLPPPGAAGAREPRCIIGAGSRPGQQPLAAAPPAPSSALSGPWPRRSVEVGGPGGEALSPQFLLLLLAGFWWRLHAFGLPALGAETQRDPCSREAAGNSNPHHLPSCLPSSVPPSL